MLSQSLAWRGWTFVWAKMHIVILWIPSIGMTKAVAAGWGSMNASSGGGWVRSICTTTSPPIQADDIPFLNCIAEYWCIYSF